jgi:hypothetical protein
MPNTHLTRQPIAITASRLLRVLRGEHASSALLVLARSDAPAGRPAFLHSL